MQYNANLIIQEKDGQITAARLINSVVPLIFFQEKLKSKNESPYELGEGILEKEVGLADLPWLTEIDLVQLQQELLFQRNKVETSKPLWFRTDVLSKYKHHEYCEMDMANPFNCVLLFLDYDKKHIVTSTLFEIHHGNIIMIRAQDFARVPPKERNHWQHYQVSDNLYLHT